MERTNRGNPCQICGYPIDKCPWLCFGQPVPGWTATRDRINVLGTPEGEENPAETYAIKKCPLYVRMPKRISEEDICADSEKEDTAVMYERMYANGMTDLEIANASGTSYKTVVRWRKLNGYEKNPSKKERNSEKRLHMYRRGMTDREIAISCGLTISAVCKWRTKNGLAANNLKGMVV